MTFRSALFTGITLSTITLGTPFVTRAADASHPAPSVTATDAAIRDWLATHPEVIDKIILDALTRQSTSPAIDKLVHDAFLRQPGMVQEANIALQAKQQADRTAQLQKALPAAHDALYNDAKDGRDGAAKPAATVVVFGDPECPWCKALQPNLARLVAEHADIAVIYKEFPILGPELLFAAKVELAAVAQGQGKYSALHAALMASKIAEHQLKDEQVFEMAKTADLDIDRLKIDMAKPEIEAKIAANKSLGISLGIQGTPGVLIGNQLVPGNAPYEQLVQIIERAKALPNLAAALPNK